jgi:oligopeptide transport system substrate-binding protein
MSRGLAAQADQSQSNRSAGFQPAVSQGFQPARLPNFSIALSLADAQPIGNRRYSRLEICATLLLAAACISASGCSRHLAPADLVIINGNEPESLDPAIVSGISEMRITKGLFEGLVRLDPHTASPIPGLAERWDVSTDGATYTFHLRPGLAWSTGEPITASDVVYSWMRTLEPATAADYAGQLFYIRNAEDFYMRKITDPDRVGFHAMDATTFKVELNQPLAFFLDLCALPALAVVPRQAIAKYGDSWVNNPSLPCSGPYKLGAWRLNDRVRLLKNPHYWDAANTQSEIIDMLPVGSPNAALNLYETKMADIVWDKDLIPSELLDVLMKRPDFHTFQYLGTCFYRFNVLKKPLDDVRVRQAFALVTDRERIIRKLLKGGEKPATHFVPEGVAGYTPIEGPGLNPQRARELLAEAGFQGGKEFPRFQFMFFSGSGGAGRLQEKMAVELQQMWREELGIEVDLRQIERKVFFGAQARLDYDISYSSWIGDYNDANTFLDIFLSNSGNNRTGWKNERYDELIRTANLQTDREKRAQIFREAETLLVVEQTPMVGIYFYAGFNYFDPKHIEGIYQNILDEHSLQTIGKVKGSRTVGLLSPSLSPRGGEGVTTSAPSAPGR